MTRRVALNRASGLCSSLVAVALMLSVCLTGCAAIGKAVGDVARGMGFSKKQAAVAEGMVRAGGKAMPIPLEEELAYGGSIAVMIVNRYGGLYPGERVARYVNLVGRAVADFSGRPELEYHFGVLNSGAVNAMSAPGGYVFITKGALARMRTESELAGVLAHEVAHIAERHALRIIRKLKAKAELAQTATAAFKDAAVLTGLVDKFLVGLFERGLPRGSEHEADRLGTETLIRLGYDPAGLRNFLATMNAPENTGRRHAFYKTHPDTAQRVRRLDRYLAAQGSPTGVKLASRFRQSVRPGATP